MLSRFVFGPCVRELFRKLPFVQLILLFNAIGFARCKSHLSILREMRGAFAPLKIASHTGALSIVIFVEENWTSNPAACDESPQNQNPNAQKDRTGSRPVSHPRPTSRPAVWVTGTWWGVRRAGGCHSCAVSHRQCCWVPGKCVDDVAEAGNGEGERARAGIKGARARERRRRQEAGWFAAGAVGGFFTCGQKRFDDKLLILRRIPRSFDKWQFFWFWARNGVRIN